MRGYTVMIGNMRKSQIFTTSYGRALELAKVIYPRVKIELAEGEEVKCCQMCKDVPISEKQYGGEWILINGSHNRGGP